MRDDIESFGWGKVIGVGVLVAVILGLFAYWDLTYNVDAKEIAVFQSPVSGELSVKTEPGLYFQGMSKVTSYKRRDQYEFKAIEIRFNDGGHATVSGTMSWQMPIDHKQVISIHKQFGSQGAVDQQLVRQSIERSLYLTAPLMSSTESFAARRPEFLQLFADQAENGVYKTEVTDLKAPDPITGELKTVRQVRLMVDSHGAYVRQDTSMMHEFGIDTQPPNITGLAYDPEIELQIKKQRDNALAIQTAQAEAKKAEQAFLTAQQNGRANAETARWEQEVQRTSAVTAAQKVKDVAEIEAAKNANVAKIDADRNKTVAETIAQQNLNVATLDKQTADNQKAAAILRGQGEATARQLVMAADGALTVKLDAWLKAQQAYAVAIGQYKGNLVPQVVTGGDGKGSSGLDLIQLLGVKAAQDLALSFKAEPAKVP